MKPAPGRLKLLTDAFPTTAYHDISRQFPSGCHGSDMNLCTHLAAATLAIHEPLTRFFTKLWLITHYKWSSAGGYQDLEKFLDHTLSRPVSITKTTFTTTVEFNDNDTLVVYHRGSPKVLLDGLSPDYRTLRGRECAALLAGAVRSLVEEAKRNEYQNFETFENTEQFGEFGEFGDFGDNNVLVLTCMGWRDEHSSVFIEDAERYDTDFVKFINN